MRMIIAGTSPTIVHGVALVLQSFVFDQGQVVPGSPNLFATQWLYAEALRCIVGRPTFEDFGGVFRKGVDSPVAALERVIRSVIGHTFTQEDQKDSGDEIPGLPSRPEEASPSFASDAESDSMAESGEGWDVGVDVDIDDVDGGTEGWDVDVDVDIDDIDVAAPEEEVPTKAEGLKDVLSEVQRVLKDGLKEIAERAETYGSGMAMDAVGLLQKVSLGGLRFMFCCTSFLT